MILLRSESKGNLNAASLRDVMCRSPYIHEQLRNKHKHLSSMNILICLH